MAVYNNLGDTIEGESVDFDGRVIKPQGAKKHPLTNKLMKLYTTDRNSHAVVRKAGKVPTNVDIMKVTTHFHRDVDDKLTADALSVYTDVKANVKIETLHGKAAASSQHGINYASVRNHTIATVKMPLHNLLKKLGMSNNTLTGKKDAD